MMPSYSLTDLSFEELMVANAAIRAMKTDTARLALPPPAKAPKAAKPQEGSTGLPVAEMDLDGVTQVLAFAPKGRGLAEVWARFGHTDLSEANLRLALEAFGKPWPDENADDDPVEALIACYSVKYKVKYNYNGWSWGALTVPTKRLFNQDFYGHRLDLDRTPFISARTLAALRAYFKLD